MIESTLFHWQSVDMYVDNIYQGTVNVQHANMPHPEWVENDHIGNSGNLSFVQFFWDPFSKIQSCMLLPSIIVIILQPLSKITERLLSKK